MADVTWEVWLRSLHPVYQTIFRALQSIGARASNGADIIVRSGRTSDRVYIEVRTRRMELTVEYDDEKKELRALWETRKESEDAVVWKVKRASISAPDVKVAKEFMEKLVNIILVQIRNNLPPENLYLQLRLYAEALPER